MQKDKYRVLIILSLFLNVLQVNSAISIVWQNVIATGKLMRRVVSKDPGENLNIVPIALIGLESFLDAHKNNNAILEKAYL